jgi:uncharacterized protein YjbI with pentapeptide repeats
MPAQPENTIKTSRRPTANKAPRLSPDALMPPQWPRLEPLETLPGAKIEGGEHYLALALTGGRYAEQEAQRVLFDQVHLKRVDLSRTRLPEVQWSDARLEGCDLSGVDWERARLRRVELVGCRLVGARLLDAQLDDVLLRDCQGDLALFWSAVCRRVRFEQVRLREASFLKANLSGVVFQGCDLGQADLREAQLSGADLRRSNLNGMQVGLRELQGAIIDSTQAIYIASLAGVVIRDDAGPATEPPPAAP